MKYASQQLFGGRRAKIGDIVLIRIQEGMFGPMIRPCIVVGINPDDGIIARDLGEGSNRNTNGFIETHTIEDVETLQVIHWTWPLK